MGNRLASRETPLMYAAEATLNRKAKVQPHHGVRATNGVLGGQVKPRHSVTQPVAEKAPRTGARRGPFFGPMMLLGVLAAVPAAASALPTGGDLLGIAVPQPAFTADDTLYLHAAAFDDSPLTGLPLRADDVYLTSEDDFGEYVTSDSLRGYLPVNALGHGAACYLDDDGDGSVDSDDPLYFPHGPRRVRRRSNHGPPTQRARRPRPGELRPARRR